MATMVIGIGALVTVGDSDGEERYTIVAPEDADVFGGRISSDSPLGRALLGRSVGDQVRVRTPGGLRVVTIVQID